MSRRASQETDQGNLQTVYVKNFQNQSNPDLFGVKSIFKKTNYESEHSQFLKNFQPISKTIVLSLRSELKENEIAVNEVNRYGALSEIEVQVDGKVMHSL